MVIGDPIMDYDELNTRLRNLGFLDETQSENEGKIYILATPLIVRFPKHIAEKIVASYDPKVEVGGVIFAIPKLQQENRILDVDKVVFLKNLSSTPEKSFFRPNIKSDISRIWGNVLSANEKLLLPIFFHSHPKIGLSDISELSPIVTSEADQKFSLGLQIPIDGGNFFVPNALVVQSEYTNEGIIVAFFGGGITPTNFREYISKLIGKTMQEIWSVLDSWIREDRSRIWILLLLGSLIAIPAILRPKKTIPIILVIAMIILGTQIVPIARQSVDELPNYFGILKSEDTLIGIPKYKYRLENVE